MNFLDKAISIINPKAAYQRERYRTATKILEDQQRKFDGAARGRRTSNLPISDGGANTENRQALQTLRSRSRHFGRNNTYASKAFKSIGTNTVGTGIIPAPSSSSKRRQAVVKALWKNWAETTECDFNGQLNFYGIQKLAMRTIAESGEVLIVRRRKKDGTLPIELQMLEPDFLDSSRDYAALNGGGWCIQGIEYDANGKRKQYWLYQKHPGEDGAGFSRPIPAEDVIHVYEILRPGQARGIPFIHSGMLRLSDFDDYEDAELVRQKIAACWVAFVGDADPASGTGSGTDELIERMEPGMVEHLPAGKTVTMSAPPTTQNYDSYSRKILQGVAAGMGLSYETLTGDLSNVNFSSGRMGWLEMQRQINDWQYNMLIPMLCDRIWKWFIEAAQLSKGMNAGDLTVTWTPPRREMIDPLKETQAITQQIRSGLRSWMEAVREQGYEPEELMAEIAAGNKLLDEYEIKLDSDGRNPASGGGTPPAEDKPDDGKKPPAKNAE
jgi:lambda family phage portal protein